MDKNKRPKKSPIRAFGWAFGKGGGSEKDPEPAHNQSGEVIDLVLQLITIHKRNGQYAPSMGQRQHTHKNIFSNLCPHDKGKVQ